MICNAWWNRAQSCRPGLAVSLQILPMAIIWGFPQDKPSALGPNTSINSFYFLVCLFVFHLLVSNRFHVFCFTSSVFFPFLLICSHEPKLTEFQGKKRNFFRSVDYLQSQAADEWRCTYTNIKSGHHKRTKRFMKSQPLEHYECSLVWHKVWQQGNTAPSPILHVAPVFLEHFYCYVAAFC